IPACFSSTSRRSRNATRPARRRNARPRPPVEAQRARRRVRHGRPGETRPSPARHRTPPGSPRRLRRLSRRRRRRSRSPGAGGPGVAPSGPGGGAPGAEYGGYLATVRRRFLEALRYPPPARSRGLTGTVLLEVFIKPDGAIGSVSVASSSSHPLLDEAALEA